MLSSLQRAAILTSEKFKGVRVNIEPGTLRIASSNAEQEEAMEELEIDYGGDAFIAKLNAAGSALIFSTFYGGTGQDNGYGVALDPSGNIYVSGFTRAIGRMTRFACYSVAIRDAWSACRERRCCWWGNLSESTSPYFEPAPG